MIPLNYKKFNNKLWLQIFYHDISTTKEYYNNYDSLYFYDPNKPNKFSILINITDELKISNSFEFLIEYDEKDYVQWKQKYNPLFEEESANKSKVDGFEFIDDIQDTKFGGLSRTTISYDGCTPSLLNGNIDNRDWYYAIGMYNQSTCKGAWNHNYLPGIKLHSYNEVSLWLRVLFQFNSKLSYIRKTYNIKRTKVNFLLLVICILYTL